MAVIARVLLVLVACAAFAAARPWYQDEIPNIPVVDGAKWVGVGHLASAGGGKRNPFGLDFAAAGHKWTTSLCKKDSDGDGFSNGQELGDPDCKWSKGMARPSPAAGRTISHPGLSRSTPNKV